MLLFIKNDYICKKNNFYKMKYSKFTTESEQKALNKKYSSVILEQVPPRSEWMAVDECFDDVIDSVEKIYRK